MAGDHHGQRAGSSGAETLREQLEHLELQERDIEAPQPSSPRPSSIAARPDAHDNRPASFHGGDGTRAAALASPRATSHRGSRRSRRLSQDSHDAASTHIRFSEDLDSSRDNYNQREFSFDSPDHRRLSSSLRGRRPHLQLETELGTELYTIESNVPDMPDRDARQPRRPHAGPSSASSSPLDEVAITPASMRRPVQFPSKHTGGGDGRFDVKGAFANASQTNATLAHYRDWVARQKERQREYLGTPLGKLKVAVAARYKSWIIEGLLRQRPLPPSVDGRHIPLNPGASRRKPLLDERRGKAYISNFIRSSRYTVWDFLPKQLVFQFSKLANFYFLVIGIMQMIPGLSTTGSYTTIGPLMAFVAISMAKEGWDDYRRYRLDKLENRSRAWVWDPEGTLAKYRFKGSGGLFSRLKKKKKANGNDVGGELGTNAVELQHVSGVTSKSGASWAEIEWQDLRVGDIICLHRDDNIPADIVLLDATGPNGIAYIETMALDGETNLKSKQASPLLAKHAGSVSNLDNVQAEVISEDPNLDLYNYEGKATVDGETMPLTMNQIVYRGSMLRNTEEAIGLVVNTGEECKIRMNASKNVHAKAPAIQAVVNRIVILLVLFVLMLAVGCTVGNEIWKRRYEPGAFYLRRAQVPFKEIFIGFIIEFNTLIPLSLYVSLEIIKLGQLFLLQDIEMYDPVTDTPMVANTTTILENLGQVSYVFSDKTGTLTENLMRFRKMSVAGTAWLHDMDVEKDAKELARRMTMKDRKNSKGKMRQSSISVETTQPMPPTPGVENMEEPLMEGSRLPRTTAPQRAGSITQWKSTVRPSHAQPEYKTEDLIHYLRRRPNTAFSRKARHFILCMALCHTCLPETKEDGDVEFQAASPDELALVEAARDLGYLLIDRPAQQIKLQFHNYDGSLITETYEVLDVIEFSSKRKRMSIIIRMPDGKLCIFTKGADSAILPRLLLSHLAIQKASAVERRATKRKSMEQEKALRRRSTQASQRDSIVGRASSTYVGRRSTIRQGSFNRRSTSLKRRSTMIAGEVDSILTQREIEELSTQPGNDEAYQAPVPGISRQQSFDADSNLDGLVDETLAMNEGAIFERCFQHIDDFASEGLRTLLFAYRYLDEDDYKKWKAIYHEATTSLVDRQDRIEAAAELIEQKFELAGATAIEDKLQQGVPETIDKLRRANIKVWMLTGDKRETAINIANSARICKPYSEMYILDATEGNLQDRVASVLVEVGRGMVPHSVVVIDGHTLGIVEEEESLRLLFFDLVARVDSVICCRASPSQKATLVKCIRHQVPDSLTLAIGDGANDIAMIQASHVGIGISGREGLQAARISDYSIAQFRFLQRLLFVHGRWNYVRTSKYILGTFWKEIVFYLVQAHYQGYNGYTGTSLFEPASLTVFNTLFTSLPVILLGIFEQDLRAATLLACPELYTYGQKRKGFNFRKYIGWMFMAVVEAIMIYYFIYAVFSHATFTADTTLFAMGSLAFTVCVIFINLKMLVLELHNQTFISFLGLFLSIGGWFAWNLFLSAIYAQLPGPYIVRNSFLKNFGRNADWWMAGIVTTSALLIWEVGFGSIIRMFFPQDLDIMQEVEKVDGVMAVFKEHAAEQGEAGLHGAQAQPGGGAENGAGTAKNADASSIRSSMSAASAQMEGWRWGGSGSGGVGGSGAAKRASRHLADEYVPPPFTPPAEERENPMDDAMGGAAHHPGTSAAGQTQISGSDVPARWITQTSPVAGTSSSGPTFVQSPIELREPPAFRRGPKKGGDASGSQS